MNRRSFLSGCLSLAAVPLVGAGVSATEEPRIKTVGRAPDYLRLFQARKEDANNKAALYRLDDKLVSLNKLSVRHFRWHEAENEKLVGLQNIYEDREVWVPKYEAVAFSKDPFGCIGSLREKLMADALRLLQVSANRYVGPVEKGCQLFRVREGYEHALVMPVWEEPQVTFLGGEDGYRARVVLGMAVLAGDAVEAIG